MHINRCWCRCADGSMCMYGNGFVCTKVYACVEVCNTIHRKMCVCIQVDVYVYMKVCLYTKGVCIYTGRCMFTEYLYLCTGKCIYVLGVYVQEGVFTRRLVYSVCTVPYMCTGRCV